MTETQIKELTESTERSKSNTHQIEEMKIDIKDIKTENKALYELATSVKLIAQDMGSIKQDIAEVKNGQVDLAIKMDTEISKVKEDQCKIKDDILVVKNIENNTKAKKWDNFSSKAGKLTFEIIKYISILALGGGITYLITK